MKITSLKNSCRFNVEVKNTPTGQKNPTYELMNFCADALTAQLFDILVLEIHTIGDHQPVRSRECSPSLIFAINWEGRRVLRSTPLAIALILKSD